MRLPAVICAGLILTCFGASPPAWCGVVINEFMAATSERRLTRDAAGVGRVGSGSGWQDLQFDSSSWSNGVLPAGYAFPGLATDLSTQMKDKTPSIYLRKQFQATADEAASAAQLILSVQYNDGFVAYLNGREITRANCGPVNHYVFAGEPACNVATTTNVVDFNFGPASAWLQPGNNVLAVQAHNAEQPSTQTSPEQITRHLPTPEFRINAGLRLADAGGSTLLPMGVTGGTWKYFVGRAQPSGGLVDFGLLLRSFTPPVGEEDDYDQPSAFSDWVELYNSATAQMHLGGWSLTDDVGAPAKWRFPFGTFIAPGGFLLVLCDNRDEANAPDGPATYLHSNFKLDGDGGFLALYDSAGQLVDRLPARYPDQVSWCSYGRFPNDPQAFGYLNFATPGETNTGQVYSERVGAVKFLDPNGQELPGGIYNKSSLTLVLTNSMPGALIRYTLNGSEPSEWNGGDYTSPLVLTQTSEKAGRVVRARAFAPGCLPSKVKTHTYLLQQPAGITNLPALLLTGDHTRDWYSTDGLLAIVGGTYLDVGSGSIWMANGPQSYNWILGSGPPAEREMHLEYYFPGGRYPVDQEPVRTDIGLRVSSSSWSRPRMRPLAAATTSPWNPSDPTQKPSFNLYFGGEFGAGSLDYNLFTNYTVREFKHLRLRAGKNDIVNPFITDEFVRRLWLDLGHVGAQGLFCSLYANGTYKGIYNLCERFREQFFQEHYHSKASWDVYYSWEWVNGDRTAFNQMLSALDLNLTNLTNWRSVTNKLNIENAADYFLLNIYCAMWDWPGNNFVVARERSAGPDSRFRFAVWDAEGAFNVIGYARPANYNTITSDLVVNSGNPNYWGDVARVFRRLASSPEFRLRFADRINRHMFNGGVLDDRDPDGPGPSQSRFYQQLSTLVQEVGAAVQYNSGTPFKLSPFTAWTAPASGRRSYLLGDTAGRQMFRDAGFWPLTEPPVFSQHGGTVPEDFRLSITSTVATSGQSATIYYTLNGADPRLEGGARAPAATLYTAPVPITQVVTIKARARNDATSEWSPLTEAVFAPAALPAFAGSVVLAEIMYHPPDASAAEQFSGFKNADDFEFVRLQNIAGVPLDLTSVRFTDGITFDFRSGGVRYLNPGANLLLVANRKAFQLRYGTGCASPIAGEFVGNLSNGGERLLLVGTNNVVLQDFAYGDAAPWPAAADGDGPSLLLLAPPANPNHAQPVNWTVSACPGGLPCGSAPQQSYTAWRELYFTGSIATNDLVAGASADPDGDGISNFVEYALGLDPLRPSENPKLLATTEDHDGSPHLVTELPVFSGASDAFLTWEVSVDLHTWAPAGEDMQILSQQPRVDGRADWRFLYVPPVDENSARFIRLQISRL